MLFLPQQSVQEKITLMATQAKTVLDIAKTQAPGSMPKFMRKEPAEEEFEDFDLSDVPGEILFKDQSSTVLNSLSQQSVNSQPTMEVGSSQETLIDSKSITNHVDFGLKENGAQKFSNMSSSSGTTDNDPELNTSQLNMSAIGANVINLQTVGTEALSTGTEHIVSPMMGTISSDTIKKNVDPSVSSDSVLSSPRKSVKPAAPKV